MPCERTETRRRNVSLTQDGLRLRPSAAVLHDGGFDSLDKRRIVPPPIRG